ADTVRLARGFFGLARDLLARVVERGLHLPDAATRIRGAASPPPAPRTVESAIPTVTLAEIYASQGHIDRAMETLRRVIEADPENAAAVAMLTALTEHTYAVPDRPLLPPEEEAEARAAALAAEDDEEPVTAIPNGESSRDARDADADAEGLVPTLPPKMLDDEPLPPRYDVDECVALTVDPRTLFVYWEVRPRTLELLQRERGEGTIVLRILTVVPTWDGPRSDERDIEVHADLGDYYVRDLPPEAVVRAAIGYRAGGVFVPVAHSPLFTERASRVLESEAHGAPTFARWTLDGLEPLDATPAALTRALAHRRNAAGAGDRSSLAGSSGLRLGSSGGTGGGGPSEERPV
ncbi:MAG: DUF4912 domain-containing protein, partial [Polyangiaceae bacterium]|nr:DUF4912 domain-containing protein [Polyangiaceae bacterium]